MYRRIPYHHILAKRGIVIDIPLNILVEKLGE